MRDMESTDFAYPVGSQPLVRFLLTLIEFSEEMHFDREVSRFLLESSCYYDTVFSRAQRLGDLELMPRSIQASVGKQAFVHDCEAE